MGRLFEQRDREREQRDELLSAYLDNELSAGERARLETQLATDQVLQAELDALRRTVTLVRDLPPAPLPRNFILPQTMAARPQPVPQARPRRAWLAPFLTTATAVVSLMFAIVLAGDLLLLSGTRQFASAPGWETAEVMDEEIPMEMPAAAPVAEQAAAEVEVVAEAEAIVEAEEALNYELLPAETQVPMPAEASSEPEATATSATEDHAIEASDSTSATVPAMGGGEPSEQPTLPPPPPSPTAVLFALPATATAVTADPPAPSANPTAEPPTVPPTPLPSPTTKPTSVPPTPVPSPTITPPPPSPTVTEKADKAPDASPTAAALARATEGDPTLTPMEYSTPASEDENTSEFGGEAEDVSGLFPTTPPPWRVLEIVLGLATLGLAIATVSAWRARRQ
ncbi:MAG: hypothetical protein GY832_02815 [Chloroflexi bacterium]|nr:hypothetical protein [Chloroflexota bacterium]